MRLPRSSMTRTPLMTLTMMTQMKILISNQEQLSKKTSTETGVYCTVYTDNVITFTARGVEEGVSTWFRVKH